MMTLNIIKRIIKIVNPRSLEEGGGGVKLTSTPSIILALNFCSLADCQKLWHNCPLFVKTSFFYYTHMCFDFLLIFYFSRVL